MVVQPEELGRLLRSLRALYFGPVDDVPDVCLSTDLRGFLSLYEQVEPLSREYLEQPYSGPRRFGCFDTEVMPDQMENRGRRLHECPDKPGRYYWETRSWHLGQRAPSPRPPPSPDPVDPDVYASLSEDQWRTHARNPRL